MRSQLYLCYEPQLTLSFAVSADGLDLFATYELLLQAAVCPSRGSRWSVWWGFKHRGPWRRLGPTMSRNSCIWGPYLANTVCYFLSASLSHTTYLTHQSAPTLLPFVNRLPVQCSLARLSNTPVVGPRMKI